MTAPFTLENRLILACTRIEPNLQQIENLIDGGPDWQAIVRVTDQWGVATLVYTNLRLIAETSTLPSAVLEQLRAILRAPALLGDLLTEEDGSR